jgi:integrase
MNKQGFSPATIQAAVKTLRAIARRVNLLNPETVKSYLAMLRVSETRKQKITEDLTRFYEYKKIPFAKPHYRRIEVMPLLPLEVEIDQLASGLGKKSATFILVLKETGMRLGECWNLKWIDLDTESCTIRVTPEKGSNPRTLKISTKLVCMINALPKKWAYIFRNPAVPIENSLHTFRRHFVEQRRKIAKKIQNPRIESINFKSLRHWRASTLYYKTKDILLVKDALGHKSIASTMKYTHLIDQFKEEEYTVKAAQSEAEAKPLIEMGFQFVLTTPDGYMLFRKRK